MSLFGLKPRVEACGPGLDLPRSLSKSLRMCVDKVGPHRFGEGTLVFGPQGLLGRTVGKACYDIYRKRVVLSQREQWPVIIVFS